VKEDYALFRLAQLDPYASEFIGGVDAIAQAAGIKSPRYLADTYLTCPSSSSVVDGILSQFYQYGHIYLVHGEEYTHPGSAAAMGNLIRAATADQRRLRTLGWRR
jgi:hypothetical protein